MFCQNVIKGCSRPICHRRHTIHKKNAMTVGVANCCRVSGTCDSFCSGRPLIELPTLNDEVVFLKKRGTYDPEGRSKLKPSPAVTALLYVVSRLRTSFARTRTPAS